MSGSGPEQAGTSAPASPAPGTNAVLTAGHTADDRPLGTRVMRYQARLSWTDHRDDAGRKLVAASAIIVQDRRNYHNEMNRDAEDEAELYFTTTEALEGFEAPLELTLAKNRQLYHAIVHGTPVVQATFHDNGIRVMLVE